MRRLSFGLLVLLLAASRAPAVTYIGLERRADANASEAALNGLSDIDEQATLDLGVWDAMASASVGSTDGNSSASASQTSNVVASEITMSGAVSVGASSGNSPPFFIAGAGSYLMVEFSIASDTNYVSIFELDGHLATSTVASYVFFRLESRGGASYGANSSGILTPDTYVLTLDLGLQAASREFDGTMDPVRTGGYSYRLIFAIPGDYNGDGIVDAADYVGWRDTLGSTTTLAADGNGNNEIDAGDYDVWRANFGRTAGSGASESNSAVPEPTSALALLAGVAAMCLRRAHAMSAVGGSLSSGALVSASH